MTNEIKYMKPWKHTSYQCGICDSEVNMDKGRCEFCGAKVKKKYMKKYIKNNEK